MSSSWYLGEHLDAPAILRQNVIECMCSPNRPRAQRDVSTRKNNTADRRVAVEKIKCSKLSFDAKVES